MHEITPDTGFQRRAVAPAGKARGAVCSRVQVLSSSSA